MAMYMGMQTQRLRINQFGYVLPTHNPLRVAEHAATLDHMLGGRFNVAFVRGYQARWFENYVALPGVKATGPWNRKMTEDDVVFRELFEECVDVIKTAWSHDTFTYKGKYWSFRWKGRKIPMTIRSMQNMDRVLTPMGPSGPWALPQTPAEPHPPV